MHHSEALPNYWSMPYYWSIRFLSLLLLLEELLLFELELLEPLFLDFLLPVSVGAVVGPSALGAGEGVGPVG